MRDRENKNVFLIIYLNKDNNIEESFGTSIQAGTLEFSWYDIKKKKKIFINKNRFIMRESIKEW